MNFTRNSSSPRRVPVPLDSTFKTSQYTVLGLLGAYAVVANGLILKFKRAQIARRRQRRTRIRAFDRFNVITSYIQSLAISDLLCGTISIPLAICNNYLDYIDTDTKCKVVRYFNIVLPAVTSMNLFVIGVERYMMIFHPFQVSSSITIHRTIVGVWIVGALLSIIPATTFSIARFDIDQDTYTLLCWYDNTSSINRQIFLGFTICLYIIPSVLLTIACSRISLHLRRRKKICPDTSSNWRFYGTETFVILIFSFVIPYSLYFLYSFISLVLKLDFSFQTEMVLRRITTFIAYTNSAVSPTVLLFTMQDLRTMFKNMLKKCNNSSIGCTSMNVTLDSTNNNTHNVQLTSVMMIHQGNSAQDNNDQITTEL